MAPRTFKTAPTLYKQCINSFLEGLKQEAKLLENNEPLPLNLKFNPPSQLTLWQLEFMPTLLVADILLHVSIYSTMMCHPSPTVVISSLKNISYTQIELCLVILLLFYFVYVNICIISKTAFIREDLICWSLKGNSLLVLFIIHYPTRVHGQFSTYTKCFYYIIYILYIHICILHRKNRW